MFSRPSDARLIKSISTYKCSSEARLNKYISTYTCNTRKKTAAKPPAERSKAILAPFFFTEVDEATTMSLRGSSENPYVEARAEFDGMDGWDGWTVMKSVL